MAVYFVQADPADPIKIGASRDPIARMAQIETQHWKPLNLILVCEGSKREEIAIHDWFSEERIQGEWFAASPRLLEFIARVRAGACAMDLVRRPPAEYVPPPIDDSDPAAVRRVWAEVQAWLLKTTLSRAEIARMAGVSQSLMTRAKRAAWMPTLDVLTRLRAAMEGKRCVRRPPGPKRPALSPDEYLRRYRRQWRYGNRIPAKPAVTSGESRVEVSATAK